MKKDSEQQELFQLDDFYKTEWNGMPEFNNYEKAVKQLIIHFEKDEDVKEFERLVDQKILSTTKSIWYPKKKLNNTSNLVYTNES